MVLCWIEIESKKKKYIAVAVKNGKVELDNSKIVYLNADEELGKKIISFTTQIDKDGNILAESEIETVKIKSGFFDKLIAFFKQLFRALTIIEQ